MTTLAAEELTQQLKQYSQIIDIWERLLVIPTKDSTNPSEINKIYHPLSNNCRLILLDMFNKTLFDSIMAASQRFTNLSLLLAGKRDSTSSLYGYL